MIWLALIPKVTFKSPPKQRLRALRLVSCTDFAAAALCAK